MMSSQGNDIDNLIKLLAKLPGLGPRSARRAVLQLIKRKESLMLPLAAALTRTAERVHPCLTCGNLDVQDPCTYCRDDRRDRSVICVIEDVSDLWALERAGAFRGLYHVLGGTLSALDGVGPDDLNIVRLIERVAGGGVREVILATNATVDGQTTAHYLMDKLNQLIARDGIELSVSQLAHGVPVGGELDYLDEGTLSAALKSRRPF